MINVSQIFLFILTDESSDECCSSALLLLVQHKTHLSEGTHSVLGLLRRLERVTIPKLVSDFVIINMICTQQWHSRLSICNVVLQRLYLYYIKSIYY